MIEFSRELIRNGARLSMTAIYSLGRVGIVASYFIRDILRAHFNLIGQYTAPIEQELLKKEPPNLSSLNIFGQIVLFPLAILSWLTALTLAPLVYNSLQLLVVGFLRATNLALIDLPKRQQLKIPEGGMPWYRVLYGLPGFFLGGLIGTASAGVIGIARVIANSFVTAWYVFASMTNLVLEQDDKIKQLNGQKNERTILKKYILGLPGIIIGSLAGVLGVAVALGTRIALDSWRSAFYSFSKVTHLALSRDQFTYEDQRPDYRKYGFGLPGLVVGALLGGTLGWGLVGFRRVLSNSFKTAKEYFNRIIAQAYPANPEEAGGLRQFGEVAVRSFSERYLWGMPGLGLGIISGSAVYAAIMVGRIIRHSYQTARGLTVSAINVVRHENEQIEADFSHDERDDFSKYVLGFPGIMLSWVPASIGFAFATLQRSTVESWKTGSHLFVKITNYAWPSREAENEGELAPLLENENENNLLQRSKLDYYGFGFPGILLGGAIGVLGFLGVGVGRVVRDSMKTARSVTISGVNLVRHESEQLRYGLREDRRSSFQKYALGFPGLIIGAFGATVGIAVASIERFNKESWKTAKEIFWAFVRQALPANQENFIVPAGREQRLIVERYVFGALGIGIGVVSGSFAFIGIIAGRTAIQSVISAKNIFATVVNQVLAEDDRFKHHGLNRDKRLAKDKYGFGLPGLILGGLLGCTLGWGIIGFGRILSNSYQTARSLSISAINLVFPNYQIETALEHKERRNFLKYGLGFPGIIFGFPVAGAAFLLSVFGRSTFESLKTAREYFHRIVEQAYSVQPNEEDALPAQPEEVNVRSFRERYLWGAPGVGLGIVSGSIAYGAIISGRIIKSSYLTAKSLTISAVNVARHENEQLGAGLSHDNRDHFSKYVLGFPGLILGWVPAGVGLALTTVRRGAIESWKTTQEVYNAIVRQVQPVGEPVEAPQVNPIVVQRSFIDRYLFGGPGLLVGAVSGSFVYVGLGLGHVFKESFDTGSRLFTTIANVGLNANEKFESLSLEQDDQRSWQSKYLLGFPGAVVGAFLGTITLAAIGIVKITTQSVTSWRSLSGSILNGSLEVPLFGGLAADTRSNNEKYSGSLGYAFAMITTLPVGIVIFTFKKVIPILFGLIAAVISSPIVATLKAINQALTRPRFVNELSPEDEIEQRFRNLYSSLTEWGQFAEGADILENQNGRKGPSAFTRKAFTFNIATITENILDQTLSAYRNAPNKDDFFADDGEFQDIIEEAKEYYNEFSCLEPQPHIDTRNEQIDKLGTFVKNYVLGRETTVPQHLYREARRNWTATFWGVKPQQPAASDLELEKNLGAALN